MRQCPQAWAGLDKDCGVPLVLSPAFMVVRLFELGSLNPTLADARFPERSRNANAARRA